MSRLTRNPLPIPAGVKVTIATDGSITVGGPLGKLVLAGCPEIKIERTNNDALRVSRLSTSRHARCLEGTYARRIANMLVGVSAGFEYVLELVGVGYRAQIQNNQLTLQLGYSHQLHKNMPEDVSATVPTPTEIILKGADKAKVGQLAAEIRSLRPPEAYKGKGVRHRGEQVIIKEAKKK